MSSFTRKDVCEMLGVEEHCVRQWMQISPFSARPSKARSPHRYDLRDLELFALAYDLQDRFGLTPAVLDRLLPKFHLYLSKPHAMTQPSRVLFNVETDLIEELNANLPSPGFVVDLAVARERVGRFLGLIPAQSNLALSLGALVGGRS